MERFKGYQDYLRRIKNNGIKPFFRERVKDSPFFYKLFLRLTNISTKKLSSIPNIKQANSILDIGCGMGESLEYIKKFLNPNAMMYGLDLEKNPEIKDFIKFYQGNIEEERLPFEDNTFDVVISNFVLEHLYQPQKLFLESFRVLKSGGYFYCSTEYYTSIFCPDYYNFYQDPTHVRPWTKRSLKTLALNCGFEIYDVGVIRWWEFLPLLPLVPFLNIFTKSNFSFIPYEILGRTVYIIAKKP